MDAARRGLSDATRREVAVGADEADRRHAAVLRHLLRLTDARPVLVCGEASGLETPARGGRALGGSAARPTMVLDGCVAEMPLYRLVDLWATGRSLTVCLDGCRDAEAAGARVAELAALLPDVGLGTPASGTHVVRIAEPPAARRGLLGLRPGPDAIAHAASDDPGRLLESLRAAGVGVGTIAADWTVRLRVVTGCTVCGVCVRACSHDALVLEHAEGRSVLSQRPGACRGEATCIGACPEGVLAGSGAWQLADAVAGTPYVLADVPTRRCSRCRTPYPAADHPTLCVVCRVRRPLGGPPPDVLERLRRRDR